VEGIGLSGSNNCPPLPDYPLPISDAVAVFYHDQVLACGGSDLEEKTNKCFLLGQDLEEWVETESFLGGARSEMTASVIDDSVFFTGGKNSDDEPMSSTLVYRDGSFSYGPGLPAEKYSHCQVTLNATHVFITGGYVDSQTMVLNFLNMQWTFLDDLVVKHRGEVCGLLQNPNYGDEVLVGDGTGIYLFSLNSLTWRDAPVSSPYGGSFSANLDRHALRMGGTYMGDEQGAIYKFSEANYNWINAEERLALERHSAAAVAVPNSFNVSKA